MLCTFRSWSHIWPGEYRRRLPLARAPSPWSKEAVQWPLRPWGSRSRATARVMASCALLPPCSLKRAEYVALLCTSRQAGGCESEMCTPWGALRPKNFQPNGQFSRRLNWSCSHKLTGWSGWECDRPIKCLHITFNLVHHELGLLRGRWLWNLSLARPWLWAHILSVPGLEGLENTSTLLHFTISVSTNVRQ